MWSFQTPSPSLPGLCGVYGRQDEAALLPSAPFHSWLMRMPWVQRSDSSLGVLLLHPHTLVMRSAEEESCHQSVTGPSEQGRSTGGSSSWPTFSLSQHLKVSSRFTTKGPDEDGEQPGQGETPTWRGWVFAFQHEQFFYTNSMKNRNSGFIK